MGHEGNDAEGNGKGLQRGPAGGFDRTGSADGPTGHDDRPADAGEGLAHDGRRDQEGDGPAVVRFSHLEMTAGPLPSSKELAGYEAVLPGAADRILRMSEDGLRSEIDRQRRILDIYAEDRRAENWVFRFVSAVSALVMASAFVCSMVFFALGMDPAATIAFASGIGLLIPRIIEAFKGRTASPSEDGADGGGKDNG